MLRFLTTDFYTATIFHFVIFSQNHLQKTTLKK